MFQLIHNTNSCNRTFYVIRISWCGFISVQSSNPVRYDWYASLCNLSALLRWNWNRPEGRRVMTALRLSAMNNIWADWDKTAYGLFPERPFSSVNLHLSPVVHVYFNVKRPLLQRPHTIKDQKLCSMEHLSEHWNIWKLNFYSFCFICHQSECHNRGARQNIRNIT